MKRPGECAVAALAIALAGCAAAGTNATSGPAAPSPVEIAKAAPARREAVPAWAMHVKAAPIDPKLPIDATVSRVMGELREPGLKDGHLSAGQLAIAAIASIEAGHRADAALLLSIACYRYEQQYRHVTEVGYDGQSKASYRVSDSAYFRLLNRELKIYGRLTFDVPLEVLAATLRGASPVETNLHGRLEATFSSGPSSGEDEDEDDDDRSLPATGGRANEALAYPALAAAFLERLRADATDKRKEIYVSTDLARTPLVAFQLEALRLAKDPFNFRMCRRIAAQLGSGQQNLLGFLSDPNSATRANAAIVLGMLPVTDDQRSQLEKRLAAETDPATRLSLAYALARHGRRQGVADIAAGLHPCVGYPCADTLALLVWLPPELRADLDAEAIVTIVGDERQAPHTRALAAALLRHRALGGPLAGRAREALLVASTARDRTLSLVATSAIASDATFTREDVLSRLDRPAPPYRALLARLERVVTPADLALLTSLMPLFADESAAEARSIVRAAARIPGPEADGILLTWFDAYERIRTPIVLALTGGRDTSPATFQHIAEADDPRGKLLLKVVTGAPDALAALEQALQGRPGERFFAAKVAASVHDPRTGPALWRLTAYEDAHDYPDDAVMRHAAIDALLAIALQ